MPVMHTDNTPYNHPQVIAARSEAELEYVRQRLQQATVASDGYRGEHQQMQKKLAGVG